MSHPRCEFYSPQGACFPAGGRRARVLPLTLPVIADACAKVGAANDVSVNDRRQQTGPRTKMHHSHGTDPHSSQSEASVWSHWIKTSQFLSTLILPETEETLLSFMPAPPMNQSVRLCRRTFSCVDPGSGGQAPPPLRSLAA